jgi:hypothetical protein
MGVIEGYLLQRSWMKNFIPFSFRAFSFSLGKFVYQPIACMSEGCKPEFWKGGVGGDFVDR